jgi:hypothetical protein
MRVGKSDMLDMARREPRLTDGGHFVGAKKSISRVPFSRVLKLGVLLGLGAEAYLKGRVSDARLDLSRPSSFILAAIKPRAAPEMSRTCLGNS